eukprot:3920757-Pyramimonas_sp.AAC.1
MKQVRLVRRENIPARPASDWSTVRIYPRVLRRTRENKVVKTKCTYQPAGAVCVLAVDMRLRSDDDPPDEMGCEHTTRSALSSYCAVLEMY